jgi:D-glycero-alpha-D-manno-heptose 1-phosphate guanylyltransferase
MFKTAIVLAGGFGTRLREVVDDRPKSMALVNDRPFLEYQMEYLIRQKIDTCVLSLGYMAELVKDHFSMRYHNLRTTFFVEAEPLGTGGGMLAACNEIDEPVFVLNGDSFFDIDLAQMVQVWRKEQPDLVMALKVLPDVSRYGAVETDDNGRVIRFEEKGRHQREGMINGGIYLFHPAWLKKRAKGYKFSFERDILAQSLETDRIIGVPFDNYFIDIGVPSDYQQAQHDFKDR